MLAEYISLPFLYFLAHTSKMLPSLSALGATALLSISSLVSGLPVEKRAVAGPVIGSNFPDPSIIRVGSTWYSFATNNNDGSGSTHVQIAKSSDFNSWTLLGKDALPNLPGWVYAANPAVWAPDVIQNVCTLTSSLLPNWEMMLTRMLV